MKFIGFAAAVAALVVSLGSAQAAVIDRGNGTVYDSTSNLTWLQDWNVNGLQNWQTASAWAEGLTFAGSSEWVLPSTDAYGSLVAQVGNLSISSHFTNVQSGGFYWTSKVESPGYPAAWVYRADYLTFYLPPQSSLYGAVAVHAGDVPAVPEPQTYAMLLVGLCALAGVARRQAG